MLTHAPESGTRLAAGPALGFVRLAPARYPRSSLVSVVFAQVNPRVRGAGPARGRPGSRGLSGAGYPKGRYAICVRSGHGTWVSCSAAEVRRSAGDAPAVRRLTWGQSRQNIKA
ncbi:putative cystathionine gamma-lyase [Carbonactinospora thermoautotrophica]|uniref:Putative cystathionine gamma-lyase n=1 Tax=Carbonactinospora thermoautotrophica TaxID=1469144 RepID=A0A132MTX5_9ACTN|nr:putative cystathionine gamma-lyase [Carbonactinospora thermoautotrophica]